MLDLEAKTVPVMSLFSGVAGLELGLSGQGPQLIKCLSDGLRQLLKYLEIIIVIINHDTHSIGDNNDSSSLLYFN